MHNLNITEHFTAFEGFIDMKIIINENKDNVNLCNNRKICDNYV